MKKLMTSLVSAIVEVRLYHLVLMILNFISLDLMIIIIIIENISTHRVK